MGKLKLVSLPNNKSHFFSTFLQLIYEEDKVIFFLSVTERKWIRVFFITEKDREENRVKIREKEKVGVGFCGFLRHDHWLHVEA